MVTGLFSLILSILGSSGFGALLGSATGLVKQWFDQKNKQLELAHERARWDFDLQAKRIDLDIAKAEAEGNRAVAIVEGSAQVESSAYQALAAAYASDKVSDKAWEVMGKSPVGRFFLVGAEFLQRSVRPVLTYALTGTALYLNIWVSQYVSSMWPMLLPDQRLALITQVFSWVFFQASAVVSYWFVNRPTPAALKG